MGSICQCPEGIYDDLDLRTSHISGNNTHAYKNGDTEEEKAFLRRHKLKRSANFNKDKNNNSLLIDKEISICIHTNVPENHDDELKFDYGELQKLEESHVKASEYYSRKSSWVSKFIY